MIMNSYCNKAKIDWLIYTFNLHEITFYIYFLSLYIVYTKVLIHLVNESLRPFTLHPLCTLPFCEIMNRACAKETKCVCCENY